MSARGTRLHWRRYALLRQRMERIPVLAPRAENLIFARATAEHVAGMRDYEDEFFTRDQMLEKVKAGERLYLLYVHRQLAWMAWSRTGLFLHVPFNQWLELEGDAADIYGVYTKPQFRRLGLAQYGYTLMLRELARDGFRRALLQASARNVASLRAAGKAGFEVYGELICGRMGRAGLYLFRRAGGLWRADLRVSNQPRERINRFFNAGK